MLKQIKKLNFKKDYLKKNKKTTRKDALKKILRLRKVFKHRVNLLNPTFKKIALKNSLKPFSKVINIKIKQNNIFCTLRDIKKNKTLYITSSGKCKVKTSKKLLRYSGKIIAQLFFEKIQKVLKERSILINLVGPKKIRRTVTDQVLNFFKKKNLIINVDEKKCFNGCRAPKKKRKKQSSFRILK